MLRGSRIFGRSDLCNSSPNLRSAEPVGADLASRLRLRSTVKQGLRTFAYVTAGMWASFCALSIASLPASDGPLGAKSSRAQLSASRPSPRLPPSGSPTAGFARRPKLHSCLAYLSLPSSHQASISPTESRTASYSTPTPRLSGWSTTAWCRQERSPESQIGSNASGYFSAPTVAASEWAATHQPTCGVGRPHRRPRSGCSRQRREPA